MEFHNEITEQNGFSIALKVYIYLLKILQKLLKFMFYGKIV